MRFQDNPTASDGAAPRCTARGSGARQRPRLCGDRGTVPPAGRGQSRAARPSPVGRGQPPAPSITPRAVSPPGNAEASGRGDDGDRDGDGVGRSVSRARPRPLAYPSQDHAAGNPQFYAAFVNYRALDGCAHVPSRRVRCEGGRCACAGQAPAPDGASDPRLPPAPQITELQLHSLRRSGPAAAERPGSGLSPSQGSEGPARPQAAHEARVGCRARGRLFSLSSGRWDSAAWASSWYRASWGACQRRA